MNKKQFFSCVCMLAITMLGYTQHRMLLNNNIYMVIDNGANVVVENSNANAITVLGTGANVVSEHQNDLIKWRIGTSTGLYSIPYTNSTGTKIPFSMNATSAGVGSGGYFNFSTYGTTNANTPFPGVVSSVPAPLNVGDRFWRVDGQSYTTKPAVTLGFTYQDASEIGGTNMICEPNLLAQRYNVGTLAWEGPFGSVNSTTNLVSSVTTAPTDLHIYWSLIAPLPATPAPTNTGPYCVGGTIQLNTATVSGATYSWTGPAGFTSSLQNPTNPATLANAGTYSVTVTVNGCTSAAGNTTVVVNPTPATPTATNTGSYCVGGTIQLNTPTVSGATYSWTGPGGFTSSLQNPTRSATIVNAGTYNVTVTVSSCPSLAGSTIVVVNPIPATPTATNTGPYCVGGTIQLNTPTVSGATYSWTGPGGFTSSLQNPTRSATLVNAGTYNVTVTVSGCTSPAGSTTVVVNSIPATPTASNTGPYCAGGTIQLNTPTVSGASYLWSGPSSFSSTFQNPTNPATLANAGSYTVTITVSGCPSAPSSATTVVVDTPPTANAGTPISNCNGAVVTLSGTRGGSATSSTWTTAGTGTFSNATLLTSSYTPSAADISAGSVVLTLTTNASGSCPAATSTVTITISSQPSASFTYSSANYCTNGTNPSPILGMGAATGTFSSTPAGLSLNSSSGVITLSTSTVNTYTVTNTVAAVGSCPSTFANTTVTIVATPATPVASSNSPICSGSTLNLSTATVSSATYSWTGPSFVNATQNPSIPSTTTANSGTYNLTVTVNGCTSATGSTVVNIDSPATVNAGAPIASCNGAAVSLAGSIGGTATSSTWTTAGSGTFSNAASLTSTYTPSAADILAGNVVLTLTTNNPAGACNAVSSTVTITISSAPSATFNYTSPNYCQNGTNPSPVFGMGASGGTFSSTPAGLSLNSGSGVITLSTSAVNTFTVTNTIPANGSCPSTFATTSVTIIATPATPSASSNSPICSGSTLNLTTATVSGATYSWTGPSFTNASQNPSIPSTTTANAGAYNLTVTVNGCVSLTGSTSVTIDSPAVSNAGSAISNCNGSIVSLAGSIGGTATSSTWTTAGSGTFSNVASPTSNYTPSAADVSAGSVILTLTTNDPTGACNAVNSVVTITISTNPTPNFSYSASSYCQSATNPSPIIGSGSAAGTFSSSPAGLSLSPSTGIITLASSTPATYTITNTIAANGSCPSSFNNTMVTVVATPATPIVSNTGSYCVGGTIQLNTPAVATNYAWIGPGSFTSISQNPTRSATIPNAGIYGLMVTVGGCISDTAFTTVVVNPIPATPVVSSDSTIYCLNENIQLNTATVSGATYSWTGPSSYTSSLEDPTVGPMNSSTDGVYSLVVTQSGCSSLPASTTVIYNTDCDGDEIPDSTDVDPTDPCIPVQTPTPLASADSTSYCYGETIQLSTTAIVDSYLWSGPSGFTSTAQNPTGIPVGSSTDGIYSLIVTDHNCASDTAFVNIVYNPDCDSDETPDSTDVDPTDPCVPIATATAIVSNTGAYCIGDSIQLSTTTIAVDNYFWFGPNSFIDSIQNTSPGTASISSAGDYGLIVTDHNCASDTAFTTVVVYPNSTVEAGANQILCLGDSTNVNASGSLTYSWNNSVLNGTFFTPTIGTMTYTVNAIDVNGCSATDSLTISVNGIPTVTANSSTSDTVCAGSTLILTGSGALNYSWNNGVENGIAIEITSATNYVVTGTDANGCIDSDTIAINLIAVPVGEQATGTLSSDTLCIGTTVIFTGNSGTNPMWEGPNGETFTTPVVTIPNLSGSNGGFYVYSITSTAGCVTSDTVELIISNTDCVNIPNLISFNGDGFNDAWTIGGLEQYPTARVEIYNRWGALVFEQSPYQNEWAGQPNVKVVMENDDNLLPSGTYFYLLDLGDGSKPIQGFIDLK